MADETQDQAADGSSGDMASEVSATIQGLGGGERLVALGAAIVAAVYVLFEVIIDEYFFSTALLLVAAFALAAVWTQSRGGAGWPVSYAWVLRVLGFAALILGIQELLSDLRNGVLDNGADIIAGLALYVGVGIMYFGSRQTSG